MRTRIRVQWLTLIVCYCTVVSFIACSRSFVLVHLPLCRQATNYTCGVAALQSILYYYGEEWREDKLTAELKSDPNNGTKYTNIAHFAHSRGFTVAVYTGMSLDYLRHILHEKKPVIVLIQAWSDIPINYKSSWIDGHYVVAIGYDDNNIYFMDPSTMGNYTSIPIKEFLDRWHDIDGQTPLNHFGMVISKGKPQYNPNSILHIK